MPGNAKFNPLISNIMNDKVRLAIDAIELRRTDFSNAEESALSVMKLILEKCGEGGVGLTPTDSPGGYIPIAEIQPQQFKPITAIRYFNGLLEVFVQNFHIEGGDWIFDEDGEWVDYKSTCTDTWFILDCIAENIEYADGYQD